MKILICILALMLVGCSRIGPMFGRDPDKVDFDPFASVYIKFDGHKFKADGVSDYKLAYGEFQPRDIEIIIPKSMLQLPDIDRGDHYSVPYRIDPSSGFSITVNREVEPIVTRGGWYAGILARITVFDWLQWVIGIVIVGVLLRFFWPIIFRVFIWVAEGFGKAFSRTTVNELVRSVQQARQAIKNEYGGAAVEVFDDKLKEQMNDPTKNKIQKIKTDLKKEHVIESVGLKE